MSYKNKETIPSFEGGLPIRKQTNYLKLDPLMRDLESIKKKALKIMAILEEYFLKTGRKTIDLICLEIGCSLGGMTKVLAQKF